MHFKSCTMSIRAGLRIPRRHGLAMLSDRERSLARSGWTAGRPCELRAVGNCVAAAVQDVPRSQPFGRPVRLEWPGTFLRKTLRK